MNNRETLIQQLSSNLEPVRPPLPLALTTIFWLSISSLCVVLLTALTGPIRSNAFTQLFTSPQFFTETIFGIAAITCLALTAFKSAIPAALNRRLLWVSYALLIIWLSFYIVGLVSPALQPSMLGKREHCVYESFLYSLLPIIAAFVITQKLRPLKPFQCSIAFSLAAGMMPALYMQIACMYEPIHILSFHIMPGLLAAAIGSLLGFYYKL